VNALRRPATLGAGDRVRFDNAVRTVVGVSGTLVRLADSDGTVMTVPLPVAATTRATSRPVTTPPITQDTEPEPEPAEDDRPIAKVIPLGIFDPFAEAQKRW
jgi:hypothetical protein